jgi:multiple sugar transport system substrate-binding protein
MRRVIFLVLASVLVLGAVTTVGAQSKVVRVLAVAGPETDALIKYAADFEKQTGITASIEQVARPLWGERKVRELLQDSGLYDVVMVGGGDDLLWVKLKGQVRSLDQYLDPADAAHLTLSDYFKKDGKLFGVPQYYNFPMIYYRKDMLEDPKEQAAFKAKYGRALTPPRTFDELEQVAEFFNRPPKMSGFFLGGVDWSIYLDYTYFMFGNKANLGDLETGELTLNSPAAKRAMTALTRMARFNPKGWETENFFDGDQLFQQGKVFMYQNWIYITKTLMEKMPGKVGVMPTVGDKQPGEHLGAFVAVIPTAAANPDNAGRFISWMLSAPYQKAQTIDTGDLPVRQDVLNDPAVRKALPTLDQYQKALPYMTYQQTTWPNEISSGISEAIWKVLRKQMTADQACDWLQNVKFKDRKAIE